jgi:uncharacterized protein YdcH (DUF465 family)
MRLLARAEKAEARIAELEVARTNADQAVVNAMRLLHEETDRAEKAEAARGAAMSEKIISRLCDERGLGDRKLLAREAKEEIMRLRAENAALRETIERMLAACNDRDTA